MEQENLPDCETFERWPPLLGRFGWLLYESDPLLAKQVGKNTKCFCWCRLHEKPSKFPLFNCPEVVPNDSKKLLGHRQSDQRRQKQTRFVQSHFEDGSKQKWPWP